MQKFQVAVCKNLVIATLLTGVLVGCATSAPSTSARQNCVKQEVTVGSRLARTTCKPEAAATTGEVKATTTTATVP